MTARPTAVTTWIDNCCKNCPDRKVGCHDEATCSKWAEHETIKRSLYEEHQKKSELASIERSFIKHHYRKIDKERNQGKRKW